MHIVMPATKSSERYSAASRLLNSVALMAAIASVPTGANAERLPTDVELTAAYCLSVVRRFYIPFAEQATLDMTSAGEHDGLDAASKAKIDARLKNEIEKGRDHEARRKLFLLSHASDVEGAGRLGARRDGTEVRAPGERTSRAIRGSHVRVATRARRGSGYVWATRHKMTRARIAASP